jgi:hypothetical protein
VLIIADTITGTEAVAVISANGGNSGDSESGTGAGGRVALYYKSGYTFPGAVSAKKGSGGLSSRNGTNIVVDDTNNDLYITTNQRWYANPNLEGSVHNYRNITVQDNSVWLLGGYYTTDTDGVGFRFNCTNFEVKAGSVVTGYGAGYRGGASSAYDGDGPGGGEGDEPWTKGSGGGYGGVGGGPGGGGTYGSETAPNDLGSGGGGAYNGAIGGHGGGAIFVNASDTVLINGNIAANGKPGGNNGWGAGGG